MQPRRSRANTTTATTVVPQLAQRGRRGALTLVPDAVNEFQELGRWSFEALDVDTSRAAQREASSLLQAAGFDADQLFVAELVIAELIGNTVRYAPGPVDMLLERDGAVSIVHVLDRGPGFEFAARLPPDIVSESGRGLFLIASLAENFDVVRRPDGGSHALVVLR